MTGSTSSRHTSVSTDKPVISRKPDPRFVLHGIQPRGKYLGRKQRELCRVDPAFLEALHSRVQNPERWRAFLSSASHFPGNACARCGSHRRRVYNGACYDCMIARNREDFALIRRGVHPPANRSRSGWLDSLTRHRREQSGEFTRYVSGPYTAEQFPTGRVRLLAPHLHIDTPDLQSSMHPQRVQHLAMTDPDFLGLLRRLGWA